jgi:energy-coupling factor transport system substrate-specific component
MTWPLASFTILGLALFAGFWWYERSHPTSKVLALVATLAALAALGRIAFAPLPNVKPTTDIVLLSGYVLGGAPGFAVGAVGALASNIVFGQGPWTPWQMGAWGLCGLLGAGLGALSGRRLGRWPLAIACLFAGLMYGAILDFSAWVSYSGSHTFDQYLAISGTSFSFNLAHALGNVVFCLAFGPAPAACPPPSRPPSRRSRSPERSRSPPSRRPVSGPPRPGRPRRPPTPARPPSPAAPRTCGAPRTATAASAGCGDRPPARSTPAGPPWVWRPRAGARGRRASPGAAAPGTTSSRSRGASVPPVTWSARSSPPARPG